MDSIVEAIYGLAAITALSNLAIVLAIMAHK